MKALALTSLCPPFPAAVFHQRHLHSLHCHYPVTMDIRRIDPSLALAFYLADRKAFEDLTERIRQVISLLIDTVMLSSPFRNSFATLSSSVL